MKENNDPIKIDCSSRSESTPKSGRASSMRDSEGGAKTRFRLSAASGELVVNYHDLEPAKLGNSVNVRFPSPGFFPSAKDRMQPKR